MGQAYPGVVDETCCEWMTFKMRNGATHPKLDRVRLMICDQVRDTEKNVRATRWSVFTPHHAHDITLSTNVDLATESLGVRVATIVVKMMKMLHRMVFGALSRSSGCRRCLVLVLVEELRDCAWWT